MYGLRVLRKNLQDQHDNVTRFLVIGSEAQALGEAANVTTSLLLTLPDTPGALLEVLAHFERGNINLSKIESRPSKRKAWDYVFFLDMDGRADSPEVAEVLYVLGERCDLVKVLGTYQKADNHE